MKTRNATPEMRAFAVIELREEREERGAKAESQISDQIAISLIRGIMWSGEVIAGGFNECTETSLERAARCRFS